MNLTWVKNPLIYCQWCDDWWFKYWTVNILSIFPLDEQYLFVNRSVYFFNLPSKPKKSVFQTNTYFTCSQYPFVIRSREKVKFSIDLQRFHHDHRCNRFICSTKCMKYCTKKSYCLVNTIIFSRHWFNVKWLWKLASIHILGEFVANFWHISWKLSAASFDISAVMFTSGRTKSWTYMAQFVQFSGVVSMPLRNLSDRKKTLSIKTTFLNIL